METSAKDLRVLVTAGGSGIGRVIARTFLEHGARVHICDVDEQSLKKVKTELPAISQSVADVAKVGDVERLFEDVKRHLGGLDVLVNNAGILVFGNVAEFSLEDFDKMVAINLRGVFVAAKTAARHRWHRRTDG